MPALFWVDAAALGCSALLAASLLLISLGARTGRWLHVSFALFAGAESAWAGTALLLKLSLWLGRGDATFFAELAVFFYTLLPPLLLVFADRYLGRHRRAPLLAAAAGLLVMAGLSALLFRGRLVTAPRLAANGTTLLTVTPLGMVTALLPAFYLTWALFLFVRRRRNRRELIMGLSVLVFLLGLALGGLLQVSFPIQSIAGFISVGLLGYGVASLQIFNPLRETAAALGERARRLELLAGIGQKTTAIQELDELLHQAIALIREQFSYFNVSILLRDGQELVLRAAAALRSHEDHLRLRIGGEGITGWVAGCGQPLLVPDVSREPRFLKCDTQVLTRSELAVPIKLKGEVIGVLDAQSAQLDAFTPVDVFTLQTVADQLAIAIDNARLYAETRRRTERLTVVNRVTAAVGATLRLDDLLPIVYREVAPVFRADAFFIALYDESAGELEFRFQIDEGRLMTPDRRPLGSGLSSLVVRNRQPVLIRDFQQERSGLPVPDVWGTQKLPTSWLGVPMRLGERVIGVICVQAYQQTAYAEEDQLLLLTIADQVAVAVENARLFEAAQAEIVERRLTEEVLRESEEKFRNLADQSPSMIFINRGGRVVYANRCCEQLMGYTREELYAPGFDFLDLIVPAHRARVQDNYARHLRGQDIPPYECTLLAKDGRQIEAILSSRLLRYGGGLAIMGVITDIASRKRTERLLHALNAAGLAMERVLEPEQIFATAGQELATAGLRTAILLTGPDGLSASFKYLSYEPELLNAIESLVGFPLEGYAVPFAEHAALREVIVQRATRLLEGEEAVGELLPGHLQVHAGRIAELLNLTRTLNAPLIVEDAVVGLLSVHSPDLTEEDAPTITAFANQIAAAWRKTRLMQDREASLRDLQRTQGELIQAQKMDAIGRLAGGIAHDFNNLLTAIGGYTQLLMDRFPPADPMRLDLEEIKKTTAKAGSLTRQLLAFSRKQLLQPKVLDLNEVVGNLAKMLRRLLGEQVELDTVLAPGLGRVRADPLQVEQVIMNLAINAADAMPAGGRLVLETSDVDLEPGMEPYSSELKPGAYVLLAVSDTGVGMDPETQSRLFEPFFTTKEQGKGTGLGLSTAYGIVAQSGGRILVYSKPGYGSTFKILLPRVEEQAPPPLPASPAHEELRGVETILLVEDEAVVRDLIRRVLAGRGYTVLAAEHAAAAMAVWRDSAPAIRLIITDVVMPGGMDGRELAETLARERPDARVLFISGYTPGAVAQGGLLPAGSHFLQKPFSPETLARKVREVLD